MSGIAIVTDSTAYLPPDLLAEHPNLRVVPLYINIGERTLHDGSISNEEFFATMESSPTLPTTSQPAPADFSQVFDELLTSYEVIVAVLISSKISGTVESARIAAQESSAARVKVVDSLLTGTALAFLVLDALEAIRRGVELDMLIQLLEEGREQLKMLFSPETLTYLQRGGRIGAASALLGNLLQIKPVLELRHGSIEVLDKVRTAGKAITRMAHELPAACKAVAVVHAMAGERARQLQDLIQTQRPELKPGIWEVGPVLGTHTGPGLVGLVYWEDIAAGVVER